MKRILILVAGSLFLMQPLSSAKPSNKENPKQIQQTTCCPSKKPAVCCPLKTRWRELWSDHGAWTRDFILDSLSNSPAAPFAAARLLRNQADLGNFLACFYGPKAGARFAELLVIHVEVFVQIVIALQANDQQALDFWNTKWRENAQDITRFLTKLNPCMKKRRLLALFLEHLAGTEREVVLRLASEWERDVQNFDAVRQHLNRLADFIARAINRQFPDKCSCVKNCPQTLLPITNKKQIVQKD